MQIPTPVAPSIGGSDQLSGNLNCRREVNWVWNRTTAILLSIVQETLSRVGDNWNSVLIIGLPIFIANIGPTEITVETKYISVALHDYLQKLSLLSFRTIYFTFGLRELKKKTPTLVSNRLILILHRYSQGLILN